MLLPFAFYVHHALTPGVKETINFLEAAIVIYLSKGYTERKIAGHLNVSYDTVHAHIKRMYEITRLPRHNHGALITWSFDTGLMAAMRLHIKGRKFFEYNICEDADCEMGVIIFVSFTA